MNEQSTVLTTEQAAKRLGVSPRTLERYRVSGEGPEFVKIGRCVRYRASKLKRWLDGCTRRSTSDDGGASRKKRDD